MDKLAVFAVVAVLLALVQQGLADIFFQRQPLNQKEMDEFPHIDFKCIPGRTTIKFEAPKEVIAPKDSDELDARRYHMNWKNFGEKDESCKMCVCSAEGKDEYCVRRPAINTNECLEMNGFTKEFNMNIPFNHDRDLSQRMRRAGATVNGACVPYVSEYTDCSKENQCTGCTRCTCSPEATWVCKTVRECPRESEPIDEGSVDDAFNSLLHEFKSKDNDERRPEQISSAKPEKKVLVPDKKDDPYIEGEIMSLLRDKRSPTDKDLKDDKTNNDTRHYSNGTITFYHTVDELNEDTLKNSNSSGTVEVPKVDNEKSLRRTEFLVKDNNITFENDLQIEPNKLQHYDQIIDNKIDSNQTGSDLLDQEKFGIKNNQTQKQKDKDLSKIVVNELKVGSEYIGDKNAPVRSNITFTPDNDTLTAMAFIAGNLLNKLWDMEKETSDEALELEAIKMKNFKIYLNFLKNHLL
ncbi:hypothetical protein NE865_11970 [Phthorimaea operculella]|nr:hypothetical protein NE865_11970 [Phthorimaea operculella]